MRRSVPILALALGLAVLAAACGRGGSETAPTTLPPATTAAPASTDAPAETGTPTQADDLTLAVYLTKDDAVAVVHRTVAHTEGVARAALEQLLQGANESEKAMGFSTAIPFGTDLLDISIADGVATVDLSGSFAAGDGKTSMQLRLAQVVYTLTQFPTVKGVDFELDGKPVTTFSSANIPLDQPQTRKDYEDVTPAILVETPAPGDTVSSPLRIAGTANVFEATVSYSLEASGKEIAKGFTTATCGTGCRGTFDVTVPFDAGGASSGTLYVFEVSAEDGSRTKVVEIPLTFAE